MTETQRSLTEQIGQCQLVIEDIQADIFKNKLSNTEVQLQTLLENHHDVVNTKIQDKYIVSKRDLENEVIK